MTATTHLQRNPASWRDSAGHVFHLNGRVLRTVNAAAVAHFDHFERSGLYTELVERYWIVGTRRLNSNDQAAIAEQLRVAQELRDAPALVLEHTRLENWTYPYEWPYAALREAALRHLEIQLLALDHGMVLSDASAFNMQFSTLGARHIDVLSFRQYREGEYWTAHRQFCEQFLLPLLFEARLDAPWQPLFRGAMEGVSRDLVATLAQPWHWLSPRWLMHVLLPARLDRRALAQRTVAPTHDAPTHSTHNLSALRPLPKSAYRALLQSLHDWISALEHPPGATIWSDYAHHNTYDAAARSAKHDFVRRFVSARCPKRVLDLGCNTGEFAATALHAGAREVIGLDADRGALHMAWQRRSAKKCAFLPLYQDAANPSPAQGWRSCERSALASRLRVDVLTALAFIHHLAIGRNVPLDQVVDGLLALAPAGVIEFVEPTDPTVKTMTRFREHLPTGYTRQAFENLLGARARILSRETLRPDGRTLYAYQIS